MDGFCVFILLFGYLPVKISKHDKVPMQSVFPLLNGWGWCYDHIRSIVFDDNVCYVNSIHFSS